MSPCHYITVGSPCHGRASDVVMAKWCYITMSRSSGGVPLNEHLEAVVWCEVEFSQSRVGHGTGPLSLVQPRTDGRPLVAVTV